MSSPIKRVATTTQGTSRTVTATASRWYDVEFAAMLLALDPGALRARLRRAARSHNGETVAHLGMGVVGKKLGKNWRLFVPNVEAIDRKS